MRLHRCVVLAFLVLFAASAPLGCGGGGTKGAGGGGGGTGGGSGGGGGSGTGGGSGGGGGVPDAGDTDDCSPACVPTNECHTAACIEGECVQTPIDLDGDGYPPVMATCGTDCDDSNADVYPGANEIVGDQIDQSCDGNETCYADADQDGYRTASTVESVGDPSCLTTNGEAPAEAQPDCNDQDATVNPGMNEVAGDNHDSNCDGMELCWRDADGDGQRSNTVTVLSVDTDCDDAGEARASATVDCCDGDARVRVGQTQFFGLGDGSSACTGWDFNCDGVAEQRYDVLHTCTPGSGTTQCVFNRAGWNTSVPWCGQSGTFVTACSGFGGTCTRTTVPREQECR